MWHKHSKPTQLAMTTIPIHYVETADPHFKTSLLISHNFNIPYRWLWSGRTIPVVCDALVCTECVFPLHSSAADTVWLGDSKKSTEEYRHTVFVYF